MSPKQGLSLINGAKETITMKGTVLDFSIQTNEGVISGDDGGRYTFRGSEWKAQHIPSRGHIVDFVVDGQSAAGVYPIAKANTQQRVVAALLAFFLGTFGAHKFYLGYTTQGFIMLLVTILGAIFILPVIAMGLVAMIEFVLYLMKTDSEFEQVYVQGRRPWF